MSEVFFSKDYHKIIEKLDLSKIKGRVGIKVHFGEKGNETYLNPEIAKILYNKIVSLGHQASLIECNVLYKGSRTRREDHLKVAAEHGFNFAPIHILDGEMGEYEKKIKVKGKRIKEARIGGGIKRYDSLIILSHFKGHAGAGFGGAFKNIGMGLGSRAGKLEMHSDLSPSVNPSLCLNCGLCTENCNFKAISQSQGKAKIDDKKCTGCAMCIAVCPVRAITIPQGGSNEALQEKIIEYSKAVIDYFKGMINYINILENITENCDCAGSKMVPIVQDIGSLLSSDPVAIEKASLDLVEKRSNNLFNKLNEVNNNHKIEYAIKMKLGEGRYQLLKIR